MKLAICSTEPADSGHDPAGLLLQCGWPEGIEPADPDSADLVIFAESHQDDASCGRFLAAVRRHAVFRRRPGRCVVHCGADRPWPGVPGFYASIERRWHAPWWTRSASYLVQPNPFVESLRAEGPWPTRHLASFVGACDGRPTRLGMLEIDDPRIQTEDTFAEFVGAIRRGDESRVLELKQHHVRSMLESRFVLCPRGFGASSIRLFEAMQVGRVPVILSDDWVEPQGPQWDRFSVRVPERRVAELPAILEPLEGQAEAMGRLAREAWEAWFAPPVLLGRLAREGLELVQQAAGRRMAGRLRAGVSVLRPHHLRAAVRAVKAGVRG